MLTMVGIGRFADFGEHTIPHQCTATDHVNTTRVNGFCRSGALRAAS